MASGDSLIIFTPFHNEPPANNYATLDLRNQHPVLDFDAASDEVATFSGVMPRNYAGGGVMVNLHYAMTSAISGDIDWAAAFERIGDQQQDIDNDGFSAPQVVRDTVVPGISGLVDVVSIPFTDGAQMDGLLANEGFRLENIRDASVDTAVSDAELLFVEIKET